MTLAPVRHKDVILDFSIFILDLSNNGKWSWKSSRLKLNGTNTNWNGKSTVSFYSEWDKVFLCLTLWSVVSKVWSWSYKQNLSVNLFYAHFRAILLVEILEQPIRMLKNQLSIILCWKNLYRIEPWSSGYGRQLMFERSWVWIPVPYTGWTWHFSRWFVVKISIVCLKRPKINKKGLGCPNLYKEKPNKNKTDTSPLVCSNRILIDRLTDTDSDR